MASAIMNTGRALLVALTLGGAAITAAPAQAASPDVSFGFSFGTGGFGYGYHDNDWSCMSDRQVRRDLRQRGYDDIRFSDRRGRIVTVRAERGNRDYRITYDSCRGRILDVDRIRRR